ncbi:MAG: DUF429 domain-containing protein [Thermomicrobium sp.]|nr:DUF429 domain-containing protein [Thermomicrobium sp.]MCS7246435.1 DUF429 domain-containing protein [Thermomicrobium sp.]MDW7982977.1 DUF429 domain-containing protein [Thermomicrobium sp.]
MNDVPQQFIGIDFSAARDAGDRMWMTIAHATATGLSVDTVESASRLLGAPSSSIVPALVRFIARSGHSVIGCDACFGLPRSLVDEPWEAWLQSYPQRFPTYQTLRQAGRDPSGRELKRLTDRCARAPFAPTNLRIVRQTDCWLREVLLPLVREGAATVAPFQPRSPDRPHLMEVCPAVSLRVLGLPHRRYKGRTAEESRVRAQILERLANQGLDCSRMIMDRVRTQAGGDALDSLVAALTVWLVIRQHPAAPDVPDEARWEGWIYRPLPPTVSGSSR